MWIIPENQRQLNLFCEESPKHLSLIKTIDSINRKIGRTKVKLASQDIGRTWKMRQERLSPCYTTKIEDVIIKKRE